MEENNNDLKELISALSARGFEGPELERQLREQIKTGLPSFKVTYRKGFGEEQMKYELLVGKDNQAAPGQFNLKEIQSTHRLPVDIDPQIIGGVDTAVLDRNMAGINWQAYWNGHKDIPGPKLQEETAAIMKGLARLHDSENYEGLQVQQMLMYKHWPEEIYDIYRKPLQADLKAVHEHSYDFNPEEWPTITADLAYLIISDRVEAIADQLSQLRLELTGSMEPEEELHKILAANPDNFEIRGRYNTGDGLVEYTIPAEKKDGWYQLDPYLVTLTPYPEITHGTFNGIDSAVLENMMRDVNWKNDHQLFIFHEDERVPGFRPGVNDIQEQLYRLSQDMVGSEVADLLSLKYLQGVTFFEDTISQGAWDRLEELPQRTHQFAADIGLPYAVNLLAGRAARDLTSKNDTGDADGWIRLDLEAGAKDGKYPLIKIPGYSEDELTEHLKFLPIPNYNFFAVRGRLLNGDRLKVILIDERKLLLEARPEEKSIALFSTDGRAIPFNFHLDPEWKHMHMRDQHIKAEKLAAKEAKAPNRQDRNKRRGRKL